MKRFLVSVAVLALTSQIAPSWAQAPKTDAAKSPFKPAPEDGPGKECLTEAHKETNAQLRGLGHPTSGKEQSWILDPNYFVGTWTFKRHVPESPMGAGGDMTGKVTWKYIEGCYYQGTVEAEGPDGPFTQKIDLVYHPDQKFLTWVETDSRGFTLQKLGRIGGDLGGQFTHHWEVPVFLYKGHTIRMKGTTFLDASAHYIQRSTISFDGEPYTSEGITHFLKEGVGARTR